MNAFATAPTAALPGVAAETDLGTPKLPTIPGAIPVVPNAAAPVSPADELAGLSFTPVKSQCAVRGPDDDGR